MYNEKKEVSEALTVSEDALLHLRQAESLLTNARSWGLLDIIGGGFVTTALKRQKIKEANQEIKKATASLRRMSEELDDIRSFDYLEIPDNTVITIADYLFDGIITDAVIQTEISDALDRIRGAIPKVEQIVNRLKYM